MTTEKPRLKKRTPDDGIYEVKSAKAFFDASGHQIVSYEVEVKNSTGFIKKLILSSGQEKVCNISVNSKFLDKALEGCFGFDYPFLSLKNLFLLGRRDWEKIKAGSPAFVAGDFGMEKNPELREKLLSLQIQGVTTHEVFMAYTTLNNKFDAPAVQEFTKWVDVTNALEKKSTFNTANPEGTDGWR